MICFREIIQGIIPVESNQSQQYGRTSPDAPTPDASHLKIEERRKHALFESVALSAADTS
jgi:hypothetical protein